MLGPTEGKNWTCPEKLGYASSVAGLARALKMSQRTLENYIKRYGIARGARGYSVKAAVRVLRLAEVAWREDEKQRGRSSLESLGLGELVEKSKRAELEQEIHVAAIRATEEEKKRLDLARLRGKLVFRDSVEVAVGEIRRYTVERLEAICKSLPAELRREVEPQVRTFLAELDRRVGDIWLDQPLEG